MIATSSGMYDVYVKDDRYYFRPYTVYFIDDCPTKMELSDEKDPPKTE